MTNWAAVMPGVDWTHAVMAAIGAIVGTITGVMGATWRIARIEPALRLEIQTDIANIENDMRDHIEAAERRLAEKIDGVGQLFDETLRGLREKINDVDRDLAKNYVDKPYFETTRRESREDFHAVNRKLDTLLERRP